MARDHTSEGTGTVATASHGSVSLTSYISGWNVMETAGAAATMNIRDSYAAASAPAVADGAAGNSTVGLHMFGVTYLTRYGESAIGTLVEFTTAGSKIMAVTSVPVGGGDVIGRNIYQTKAAAPTTGVTPTNAQWFLVTGVGLSTTAPATTIAAASNGLTLPQSVVAVAAVADFKPITNGKILVTTSAGIQVVSYAAQSANTFTGCTGGEGIMSTGGAVTAAVLADNTSTTFTANLADGSLGSVHPPTYDKAGPILVPLSISASQSGGESYGSNVVDIYRGGGVLVETLTGTTRWTVVGQ